MTRPGSNQPTESARDLVRPVLPPDQFAYSHRAAIQAINGFASVAETNKRLIAWAGRASGSNLRTARLVDLLAHCANMETLEYLKEHTLMPLRRAIAPRSRLGSGNTWHAVQLLRPGAYWCSECVRHDVAQHGMSFWHCEHQLTGLFWCPQHLCALQFVESSSAFLTFPSRFGDVGTRPDPRWVSSLARSEPISRFIDMQKVLRLRTTPLVETGVARLIYDLADQIGLHHGTGKPHGRLLSDFLLQRFDGAWLETVIPGVLDKQIGSAYPPIDDAMKGNRQNVKPAVYLLAYAAMHEDSDLAIRRLIAGGTETPPASSKVRGQDDAHVRWEYVRSSGDYSVAARKLDLENPSVHKKFTRAGLPNLRAKNLAKIIAATRNFVQERMPLDKACRTTNVPKVEMEALLRVTAKRFASALLLIQRKTTNRRLG